jgi:hypothetical protein
MNSTEITGTKFWISGVDQADFGVLRVVDENNNKAHVLFDFNSIQHSVSIGNFVPIGMDLARPGEFSVDKITIPQEYILGYQGTQDFFQFSSFHDYCFTTNYLGCTIALFKDISEYAIKNNCEAGLALNKIKISIANLVMTWEDNLDTLSQTQSTDEFWHRRNTQYVQGKNVLITLISLILELGVSYYLDAKSPFSQRFRDALMLTSHMKPLVKNAQEMHFVRF